MIFKLLLVVGVAAALFPAIRRRLKGVAGLVAVAAFLFLLVVSFAAGR
jgi:hypothetical protein